MKERARAALLAALLVGCGGAPDEEPARGPAQGPRTNKILLISLDTLRADHLSLHGYSLPTSPGLEEFAAHATTYTRALAAAPWTLPSHASMFTGLYPIEHGARTYGEDVLPAKYNNVSRLVDEHLTLAEVLQAEGWATGAVVANLAFMDERFGVAQGFDHYDQKRAPVEAINERLLAWIEGHRDGPFFAFANYMDTHRPYNARPRRGFPKRGDPNALKEAVPYVLDPTREVPPGLLETVIHQYDTAIANLDAGLAELFEELRALGIFDEMLIVVTSDHGEFLGEKDLIEHSKDVYQGALHVPLIVKAPGQTAGAVDEDWISHVHLPGLILAHADVSDARTAITRFSPHWPRAEVYAENHFSRTKDMRKEYGDRFRRERQVVVRGDAKYIDSTDGKNELFDLGTDPREERNLLEGELALGRELAALLSSWLRARPTPPAPLGVTLDEQHMEEMRDMGYAGDDEPESGGEQETEDDG